MIVIMQCKICNKIFETVHQLSAHSKIHSPTYDEHKSKTILHLTKQNRKKSIQFEKEYKKNPKYCVGCSCKIPIEKFRADRKVRYCSRQCATTYTNLQRAPRSKKSKLKTSKRLKEIRYDPKRTVIVGPFTKLILCQCQHCYVKFYKRSRIKYCDVHVNLYKSHNRNRYAFTFSISQYPELFDGVSKQLKQHGMWSYSNTSGITRDHKISVTEAIKNNYDPYYIRHPLNCQLMTWAENNKKKTKSSLKYEELVRQVNAYEFPNAPSGGIEPPTG